MDPAQGIEAPESAEGGPLASVGVSLVYVGFTALAVSAGWTTGVHPFSEPGLYQRHMFGLVSLVLIGAAAIGRGGLAARASGKLLCAVGGAACMSVAVDPTFEDMSPLAESLPTWFRDAYPGLATAGWIVAAIGALVWWAGGGRSRQASPYRGAAAVCVVVVGLVGLGLRYALLSAGYDVPLHPTGLFVWRAVEMGAVLVTAMSVCGERKLAQWPMLIFGLGLAVHVARGFLSPPLE